MNTNTNMEGVRRCGLGMGQVDIMARHFLIAAVWADAEEGKRPRASKQAMDSAREWVKQFLAMVNPADIMACVKAPGYGSHPDAGNPWAAIGHDLWLTSRGHGVGFWDRDELPEDVGQRLTEVCRVLGDPGHGFECYRGWVYLRAPEVKA